MKPSRVVVVGGGVIGLACARELARRERAVTVVDAGMFGGGVSRGNAGWICPTLVAPLPGPHVHLRDARLHPSLSLLPWLALFARNCTRSRYERGFRLLQELCRDTLELYDELDVEQHRQGLVIAGRSREGLAPYRRLAARLPHAVEELDGRAAAKLEPALADAALAGALYASVDRHVQPEALTAALVRSLRSLGCELREHWPAAGVERRGSGWVVRSPHEELRADAVVVAAGVASDRLLRPHGLRARLVGARGYSVDVRGGGVVPRHAVYLAEAKLAISPFASAVRIAGVLELGGRPRAPDLVAEARPYLGGWRPEPVAPVWSGLRPVTPTGLPLIGRVTGGLYVAAGHAMLGVTLAPATARRLAALLVD